MDIVEQNNKYFIVSAKGKYELWLKDVEVRKGKKVDKKIAVIEDKLYALKILRDLK